MNIRFLIMVLILLIFTSCESKKKKLAFYDSSNMETEELFSSNSTLYSPNEVISVPFVEKDGVKFVKVKVNGLDFEMIFDTGCSSTLISIAEACYLYEKGYLTDDDYLGKSKSTVADGRIVNNMVFNLKEVVIDNKIRCRNVTAIVSSNTNSPLLLGNEVLDRVASYTIDNERRIINFKLK